MDIVKVCKVHGELTNNKVIKEKNSRCKECTLTYHKKYREKNLLRLREYYANNIIKIRKKQREWRDKNKEYLLKRENGIILTKKQYEKLLIEQNYLCKICKNPEKIMSRNRDRTKSLCVDHCHVTKKIRGLLCHMCNTSLGGFKDSIELLESAINYLKTPIF